jgi:hypothetical protein
VDREPVRSVGTRTMIDVLKSVLFTRRTSEDDLTEIERGSSVRMVCVPVVDGRRRRQVYVDVSLTPGADWWEVFGHPPYQVFGATRPPLWTADPMVELSGRSSSGDWTVRVTSADLPTIRAVLARVTDRR